ncbi:MAG: serine hydrolase, partial [Bacteroidota bacterium]
MKAQLLAGLTCGLNLVCALGMLVINRLNKNNERLNLVYGVPKAIAVLLSILLLTSVLAVGLTVVAVLAWLNNEWS